MKTLAKNAIIFCSFVFPLYHAVGHAVELKDTTRVNLYRQLASGASRQGKLDSCMIYLHRERDLCYDLAHKYDSRKRWADVVNSLAAIGNIHRVRSELDQAEENLKKALALGREKLGSMHFENANTCNNLGIYYKNLRDYEQALRYFETSFDIFVKNKGPGHRMIGHLYNNLGVVSKAFQEYDKAIGYYQHALDTFEKGYGQSFHRIGMVQRNLGLVYLEKKEFDHAIHYLLKSLSFYMTEENEVVADQIVSLKCLGRAYFEMENFAKALEYYEKAMALNDSLERPYLSESQNICKKLGRLYLTRNDLVRADSLFQRALNLATEIWGRGVEWALVMAELCELYQSKGDYYAALHTINQAIDGLTFDKTDTTLLMASTQVSLHDPSLLQCLMLKAETLEKIYDRERISVSDLKASFETWGAAIELLDRMRGRLDNNNRLLLNQTQGDQIYRQAVRVALRMHEVIESPQFLNTAFYWSEKSKANILYGLMIESRARSFSGIPDSLIQREHSLTSRISYWERRRAKVTDDQERNHVERQMFSLLSQKSELIRQFETQYPDYFQLKYQTEPVDLETVQSILEPGTAVVSYFFTDKDLQSFIITHNELQTVRLPVDSMIADQINSFCRSIRMMDKQNMLILARSLGRKLFEPVFSHQPPKKLVIIPHDVLYRMPFEALVLSEINSDRLSELDFLIRHVATSYHYSVSLYALVCENRQSPPKGTRSFAGFAPVFAKNDPSGWIADVWGIDHPAITRDGTGLQELPYSATEISQIAEQLTQANIPATCFMENDATEYAFKTTCSEYNLIHLASHGLIDHENPQCSAIAFYHADSTGGQDNLLYSGEIYTLALNADLVVLSCCESGTGKLIKGEGLAALTRGFLYAGANNLLVSLWNIPDKTTSCFMPGFYQQVTKGGDYSQALQKIKCSYLDHESTSFPYYWSGFILVGR